MMEFQFVNTENYRDDEPPTQPLSLTESRYFCHICDQKLNDVCLNDDDLAERFKMLNYFTCNICYQVFRNFQSLKDHQIEHFKGTDLKVACVKCTHSSKTFNRCGTLDEVFTKNDVRLNAEYLCELCDRCFDDKHKYLRHIRDHYDRVVYVCDYCNGMKIIGLDRWNIHKKTVHEHMELLTNEVIPEGLSYKCSICSIVIGNTSEFQKHLSHCRSMCTSQSKLIDGDSSYCAICSLEMPEIRQIKEQLETDQPNKISDYYRTSFDSLNCLMCYKVFMSVGDLKDHQKEHFDGKYEKRFACVRCTNRTNRFGRNSYRSSKTNAVETKANESTFCSTCDKFISTRCWMKHIRNHNDRVVYQCENCLKISIGYIRYQNHLQQSSNCSHPVDFQNDKPDKESKNYTYQCDKCKRKFARRSFKVHIEESDCYEENKCKTCLKRFVTKNSLNEHRVVCLKVDHQSKFDCSKCSKSFHTRRGFHQHSNICQKTGKPEAIRCEQCNLSVTSAENHWNDFHRRKPVVQLSRVYPENNLSSDTCKQLSGIQFGCLLCDDTFGDRRQLINHMQIHYSHKAVQTTSELFEDPSDISFDVDDSGSKDLCSPNVKCEKWEEPMPVQVSIKEDEGKFMLPLDNEIIKSESVDNFVDMWTSDNMDNVADDDLSDINFDANDSNETKKSNLLGMTMCCLCENFIPDLILTDDVVNKQISTFGECICYICFQVFNKIEKLREHESSHFNENLDGHQIACRLCAWSPNVFYTDSDFFRLENEHQCYICMTKVSDLRTLRRHKRSHLSLCVFTCKVCNKKSISDERHRSHLRNHKKPELATVTNRIVRKCTICSDEATHLFRDENDIEKMFQKFGGGPCLICFTYINDKRRYISHERSHMEDQQLVACFKCCNSKHYTDDEYHRLEAELKCFICDTKLSSMYNLHLHKRKHLDRVVYTCSICLSLVVGTRNHSHHMYKHGLRKRNREEEVGRFECDFCQKVFPHKSSLPAHFKQHLNKQRVPCPQCTMTFASKGNLTQHIKQIHLNIRKHVCELCGKAFGHPHNLKSHMVKHSGEKPYQCPICLKRFGYYSRMKTHAWIHSGLKPYKCDQCDRCYNDSTDLRRHKRIHGGVEKKFECELCKIKFYEQKYLRAHRASAHKFLVQ